MKRLLARLFGSREATSAAASPGMQPVTATPAGTPLDLATIDLDHAFLAWLTGLHPAAPPTPMAPIFDELARLARDPANAAGLVPRVPAVIPQLLRSLRDEASSATALARQVSQDAMLVAEVIREVNSPYYRPATPIRNLEGAVLLLGQNGLRMLLARVAFRPVIGQQSGPLARQVAPQLWRQSEACARGAALLAPGNGADAFEAYLAGLMHNVGLVVAYRVIDKLAPAGSLPDLADAGPRLLQAARLVSARVATQWELPAAIGQAITHAGPGNTLALTLGDAERLSRLRMLADAGHPDFVRAAAALSAPQRHIYNQLVDQED